MIKNKKIVKVKSDIIPINISTVLNRILYRYIPLRYVQTMLENKKVAFVNPKLWNDPFERIYLETDYSNLNYKRPSKIYCLCTRNSTDNEEASWKVYSDGNEPVIRVQFDTNKLFKYLDDFGKNNKCNVYFAEVNYKFEEIDIKRNLYKDNMLYNEYFLNFDEYKYVKLMSLKRPAFEYEKEFRFFIIPKTDSAININKDILEIPINNDVFKRFDICPFPEMRNEERNQWANKVKKQEYVKMVSEIKKLIQSKIPGITVQKSNLYQYVKPIEKIL